MRLMSSWAPSDRIAYKAASFAWGSLAYVAIGLVQILGKCRFDIPKADLRLTRALLAP